MSESVRYAAVEIQQKGKAARFACIQLGDERMRQDGVDPDSFRAVDDWLNSHLQKLGADCRLYVVTPDPEYARKILTRIAGSHSYSRGESEIEYSSYNPVDAARDYVVGRDTADMIERFREAGRGITEELRDAVERYHRGDKEHLLKMLDTTPDTPPSYHQLLEHCREALLMDEHITADSTAEDFERLYREYNSPEKQVGEWELDAPIEIDRADFMELCEDVRDQVLEEESDFHISSRDQTGETGFSM